MARGAREAARRGLAAGVAVAGADVAVRWQLAGDGAGLFRQVHGGPDGAGACSSGSAASSPLWGVAFGSMFVVRGNYVTEPARKGAGSAPRPSKRLGTLLPMIAGRGYVVTCWEWLNQDPPPRGRA